MTHDEIRAMFIPGQRWRVRRQSGRLDEIREVSSVDDYTIYFQLPNGRSRSTHISDDIIKARPGHVEWLYDGDGDPLILTLIDAQVYLF